MNAFEFTICTVADAGKTAVKRITPTETIPYAYVKWWRFEPAVETSLEGMAERLRGLALQPKKMIVMGSPVAGLDLRQMHRRLSAAAQVDAGTATLCGPDRLWIPIDLDDVSVPFPFGRGSRLVEAATFVRDNLLPPEFHGVRMIAVPSASTGRKGDTVARLRLFAAFDRAHPLKSLKDWAKGAAATLDLPIDSSPVQAGHPTYTGRPVFEDVGDPVPHALHATILAGNRDFVALEVDRFAPKLAAIEAKVDRVAHACGSNWRGLLNSMVGGDEGFCIPLTRGIGVAVRAGAAADEIHAVVASLLAARADPGRRRQYGRSWVQQAIDSFRRRDDATRAATQHAWSQLFGGGKAPWM